jgi:hypothetical protein
MIDLQQLHQAGADVAGVHGDAWLRCSAVRNDRLGILDQVHSLHQQLGRRIIVPDLSGAPVPQCAGGAPEQRHRYGATPTALRHALKRSLIDTERQQLLADINRVGSREALANQRGVNWQTIARALEGEALLPDTIPRLLGREPTSPPDGDIDPPAPADEPAQPLPGEAPGQATTTTAQPQQTTPMPDALFTDLEAAIADRGRGSIINLAKYCGIGTTTFFAWRRLARIPERHHAAVRAWIDGAIAQRRHRIASRAKQRASAAPQNDRAIRILAAMGCQTMRVYVISGNRIEERQAVVL